MRPLRYSINITVDGCVDHTAVTPTEAMHRHSAELLAAADALLFGRVIYEMMEAGWREVARDDELLDGRPGWMLPFAHIIDRAPKFVVGQISFALGVAHVTSARNMPVSCGVVAVRSPPTSVFVARCADVKCRCTPVDHYSGSQAGRRISGWHIQLDYRHHRSCRQEA